MDRRGDRCSRAFTTSRAPSPRSAAVHPARPTGTCTCTGIPLDSSEPLGVLEAALMINLHDFEGRDDAWMCVFGIQNFHVLLLLRQQNQRGRQREKKTLHLHGGLHRCFICLRRWRAFADTADPRACKSRLRVNKMIFRELRSTRSSTRIRTTRALTHTHTHTDSSSGTP